MVPKEKIDRYNTLVMDLWTHRFTRLPFSMSQSQLAETAETYREWLENTCQNDLELIRARNPNTSRVGYLHSSIPDEMGDDYLQYEPGLEEKVTSQVNMGDLIPLLNETHLASLQTATTFLEIIEERYPGARNLFSTNGTPHVEIRLIRFGEKNGKNFYGHNDVEAFTGAVYQSHPGLGIMDSNNNMVPITHEEKTAAMWVGSGSEWRIVPSLPIAHHEVHTTGNKSEKERISIMFHILPPAGMRLEADLSLRTYDPYHLTKLLITKQ